MTPNISLVAVCCSNDSGEFLEQPHVLDGDDRLIAEGFEKLNLRWGEGVHLDTPCDQDSNEFPMLTKGHALTRYGSCRRYLRIGKSVRGGRRECEACHAPASSETWLIHTDFDMGDSVWDQNEPAKP